MQAINNTRIFRKGGKIQCEWRTDRKLTLKVASTVKEKRKKKNDK